MRPSIIRVAGALLITAMSALVVTGCVPSQGDGAAEGPVVVITGERGLTPNPYSPRLADRRVGRLLFRGLMVTGADGSPVADLAEEVPTVANGGIRDGGRTVVYRIRDDAKWHDGTPLTVNDVEFTIRLLAEGSLVDDPAEDLGHVAGVRAPDERTVEVTFSRPDSVLAWRLAPYVLPEHLLGTSPDPARDAYWYEPVGSGPYRLTSMGADGVLDLRPIDDDGLPLRVEPYGTEADAARAFNEAATAVWLDAPGEPASPVESLSTTWGPVWKRLVFDVRPGTRWANLSLRRAVAAMTTSSVPAGLPAAAYPYGILPPSRSEPDTKTAAALFESAGYRVNRLVGARTKAGKRLDLFVGTHAISADQAARTQAITAVWASAGMHSAIGKGSPIQRTAWTEYGDVSRGVKSAYLFDLPEGRPWGWAFQFVRGDHPSWERTWALNHGHLSDDEVQGAYEAARAAPDPAAARSAIQRAGRRIYALAVEIDLWPVPERVLHKGLTGVSAWPSRDEALAQAVEWRRASASSEATPLR